MGRYSGGVSMGDPYLKTQLAQFPHLAAKTGGSGEQNGTVAGI